MLIIHTNCQNILLSESIVIIMFTITLNKSEINANNNTLKNDIVA